MQLQKVCSRWNAGEPAVSLRSSSVAEVADARYWTLVLAPRSWEGFAEWRSLNQLKRRRSCT